MEQQTQIKNNTEQTKKTMSVEIESDIYKTLERISKVSDLKINSLVSAILKNEIEFFRKQPSEFLFIHAKINI